MSNFEKPWEDVKLEDQTEEEKKPSQEEGRDKIPEAPTEKREEKGPFPENQKDKIPNTLTVEGARGQEDIVARDISLEGIDSVEDAPKENKEDLVARIRLSNKYNVTGPVSISEEDAELIFGTASTLKERLEANYHPGFGVFPSAGREENFYGQVWARDFAHAAGNYYVETNPRALADSLGTIFTHQRNDGMLPFKVESEYGMVRIIPGMRRLAKPLFNLIEGKIKGRTERPQYEGEWDGAEDTVPAIVIAAGEFFLSSGEGRQFIQNHFEQLKKAMDFFRTKTDSADGLAVIKHGNPDWTETIQRKGKLGLINVSWARSLRLMEYMSRQLGHEEDAKRYQQEFRMVKKSVMEKIYNKEEGYFRAQEGDDRLDTAASIFGALYLLSPEEAVRVEENLRRRVKHSSGLKNFDPPYPKDMIQRIPRLFGNGGYHNEFVWPWVTCQNIQVKIKIALQHSDEAIREQYKKEAVEDLLQMSELFKKAGGAYEIFRPDEPVPAKSTFYSPPQNLMASMAAYDGAYSQLKRLGWIE